MFLDHLAEIFTGLSFRSKIEPEHGGKVAVIQLRDVEHEYSQFGTEPVRITGLGVKKKYFLQNGDLLLVAKGGNNKAILFDPSLSPAVPSSSFFVIRCDESKIYPPFLEWFINHPQTQNIFTSQLTGTYTPTLSKPAVESLEVPMLPMETQMRLGHLYALQREEQHLLRLIKEKRSLYIDQLLINAIAQEA